MMIAFLAKLLLDESCRNFIGEAELVYCTSPDTMAIWV